MGLPRSTFYRSTFYDVPAAPVGDVELVAKIVVICDEFETYGYRRVRAELRHQGFVVNGKKIRRLMRGLQPKRRRRYVITTNSDHESPIFPDLARDQKIDGPQSALGRGHNLHRDRDGLRVPGRDPRWVVAPGGGLCDQPLD
jgi:hypothetical protein